MQSAHIHLSHTTKSVKAPAHSLRPLALALAVMLAAPWASAQVAGTIEFVQGQALIRTSEGQERPVQRGGAISNGETIDTQTGRVQMRMVDGAYVSLQNDTVLRLEDYRFKQPAGEDRSFMALVRGGLRTVSGVIGRNNKQAYRLQTATATIGIRGTGYTVTSGDEGVRVRVSEGAIAMCNDSGCLDVAAQQTGFAPSANVRPVMVSAAPQLPPVAAMPTQLAVARVEPVVSVPVAQAPTTPAPAPVVSPPVVNPPVVNPPVATTFPANAGIVVYSVPDVGGGGLAGGVLGGQAVLQANFVNGEPVYQMVSFANRVNGGPSYSNPSLIAESYSDGIIAWGRWTDGVQTSNAGVGRVTQIPGLSYVVGASEPTAPIGNVNYIVSGSTSPVVSAAGSQILEIGTPNSVTGKLIVNFPGATTGVFNYVLNVPTLGQTYTLSGNGVQHNGNQLYALSTSNITSVAVAPVSPGGVTPGALGCVNACTGALAGARPFYGVIVGTNAERAGGQYGFTTNYNGQNPTAYVSGAVVFTRVP
jgi:FecR protein